MFYPVIHPQSEKEVTIFFWRVLWGNLFKDWFATKWGSWLSPISGNALEARQEIQPRLYWGTCCSRVEREQTTGSLAGSLPEGGGACSLHGVRVGVCPGVGWEGWLRCFAHPLGGVVCRGHAQYPAFAVETLLLLQALQK